MRRRTVLAGAGVVALGSLAGCLGPTATGKQPLSTNPVGQNLDQQPRLGRPRTETGRTLVMFQSPACVNCADFHERTFPEIRETWVRQGKSTVYARNANVVGWALNAAHALEETRLQAPDLYWTLKSLYYEHQGDLKRGNVADRTRSFLEDEAIDADAVARAARTKPHSSAIEIDKSAFSDGVHVMTTPTTWVFEDGEFVTTVSNQGFDTFVRAIQSHD